MGWLERLGLKAAPSAATDDPTSPTYVPTPKAKDPGAMHPLVRAKLDKPKARATGVGIVYDRDGRPKITRDWVEHLTPTDRAAVDQNLAAHGWKINPDLTIARA